MSDLRVLMHKKSGDNWVPVTDDDFATGSTFTTSAELKALISDETGSGALVFATSPTLVTPVLGVATATSINGNTISVGTGTLNLGYHGTIRLEDGLGYHAYGGSVSLKGGGDEDSTGGVLELNGGTGFNCRGGNISSNGGSSSDALGGDINMSGGSLPGGDLTTSNGGGSINTTGVGSIQLGALGTRTTVVGTATTDRAISLPNGAGTLALTSQANGTITSADISDASSSGGNSKVVLRTASGGVSAGATGATAPRALFSPTPATMFYYSDAFGSNLTLGFNHEATEVSTIMFPNASSVASGVLVGVVLTKTDTGDPTGVEGFFCTNTFDNTFKVYADGGWRSLASW